MNLADIKTIEQVLRPLGFSFKKSLGQNFLINPDVCPAMANAACDKDTAVIEIGPGIGVLTKELAKAAGKVVTIELDERLKPVLSKTLAEQDNVTVIFGDAMKLNLKEIIDNEFKGYEKICVCANLPYYITSPVIMMLLENRLPLNSITVMVQKEAAERLAAEVGTREAGAVTVAVNYYATAELLFEVNRNSFMPPPNVDSAVIKLNVRKSPPVRVNSEADFFKFVKAAFAQRRKTLVNTVSNSLHIDKEKIKSVLNELKIEETIRSEQLTLDQLCNIANKLF